MSRFKPLGDRILIERSLAQKTKGGIFLPDSAQEKPKEGKVIAVGEGKRDEEGKVIPLNVKPGDLVLFTNYAGTEVKGEEEDKEYLIMSETDLLGILN